MNTLRVSNFSVFLLFTYVHVETHFVFFDFY